MEIILIRARFTTNKINNMWLGLIWRNLSISNILLLLNERGRQEKAGKLVPSCPRFDIRNGRGSLRWKLSSSWKYPVVMAHFWMACHSKHTQLEFICWHQYKLGLTKILQYISPNLFTKFRISDGFRKFFPSLLPTIRD